MKFLVFFGTTKFDGAISNPCLTWVFHVVKPQKNMCFSVVLSTQMDGVLHIRRNINKPASLTVALFCIILSY
jgi:hypothetical protein